MAACGLLLAPGQLRSRNELFTAAASTAAAPCLRVQNRRAAPHSSSCATTCSLTQQPGSRRCFSSAHSRPHSAHRTRQLQQAAGPDATLPVVSTEEEFEAAIHSHDLVVVDFMARWCRKCIYLKPKLEKMLREDFPGLHILFVDVNAISSSVIRNAGVKKMPTIQLYKNGEKGPEHIAAEGAIDALEKIKLLILRNTDLKLPERTD